MSDVTLGPELREWILSEKWIAEVMDYLRKEPTIFYALAASSELEGISNASQEEKGWELISKSGRKSRKWEAENLAARAMLDSGWLDMCVYCAGMILCFGDGQTLSWPIMDMHKCEREG